MLRRAEPGDLMPNLSVNRLPGKLRLPVPSGLRPPVAGYLER